MNIVAVATMANSLTTATEGLVQAFIVIHDKTYKFTLKYSWLKISLNKTQANAFDSL